jgi:dienelactone hydrolase
MALIVLIAFGLLSCSSSKKAMHMDKISKHFYPMPSSTKNLEKEWVIILPGYSGLKVFKDTGHYFRAAEDLNAAGFDVIVVEYKKASRKGGYKFPWEFSEGVKWATEQAIEWGKSEGHIQTNTQGHIVSWSAGGEGTILLLNDSAAIHRLHIGSAALYYPSNRDSIQLKSNLPILVQTGEADNVTTAKNISNTYDKKSNVEFIIYPDARHGFDVESITEKKKLQIIPLFGKKFYFQYNEQASKKSKEKLIEFLLNN